jgi:hypothetical protein
MFYDIRDLRGRKAFVDGLVIRFAWREEYDLG